MNIENEDPPEYHLASLNRDIRDLMNLTLRRHGLKLVEWRLLQCLETEGALTVSDLATLAVIERTVTSRLVDKLTERGFVSKIQMPGDRRFSQVSLTEAGLAQLQSCTQDVNKARAMLFDGLSQEEILQFLAVLQQMQANAAGAKRGRRQGGGKSRNLA